MNTDGTQIFQVGMSSARHPTSFCLQRIRPDESRTFPKNVPTWIEFTLSSPAFFEQLVDHPYSCLRFSARSKLRDASLHSPRPIRFCCRARDVEAVFARQQIGDYDDGNPSVAFKKRFHDCRIKILFKIDLIGLGDSVLWRIPFWFEPRDDCVLY